MKTIILGVCDINRRQHFCGLWPTIADAVKQLSPMYELNRITQSAPLPYNAVGCWEAVDTHMDYDLYRTQYPEFPGYSGTEEAGFALYEILLTDLPGFMPFDED